MQPMDRNHSNCGSYPPLLLAAKVKNTILTLCCTRDAADTLLCCTLLPALHLASSGFDIAVGGKWSVCHQCSSHCTAFLAFLYLGHRWRNTVKSRAHKHLVGSWRFCLMFLAWNLLLLLYLAQDTMAVEGIPLFPHKKLGDFLLVTMDNYTAIALAELVERDSQEPLGTYNSRSFKYICQG